MTPPRPLALCLAVLALSACASSPARREADARAADERVAAARREYDAASTANTAALAQASDYQRELKAYHDALLDAAAVVGSCTLSPGRMIEVHERLLDYEEGPTRTTAIEALEQCRKDLATPDDPDLATPWVPIPPSRNTFGSAARAARIESLDAAMKATGSRLERAVEALEQATRAALRAHKRLGR